MYKRNVKDNVVVWGFSEFSGQDLASVSLCEHCERYMPDKKESCRINKEINALCRRENVTLPVFECQAFVARVADG